MSTSLNIMSVFKIVWESYPLIVGQPTDNNMV